MIVTTSLEESIPVGARTSLFPSEIVLLTADMNYTIIHLSNGKKMMVSYTLGKLHERLLSSGFFVRVNRYTLVNLQFVYDFTSDYLKVKDHLIHFSRRRKSAVLPMLKDNVKPALQPLN